MLGERGASLSGCQRRLQGQYLELPSTRAQMRETVFEYVETDYNRQRRHSTLGHISPEAFEARMSA